MRAAGNLAGVEFISAPWQNANADTWNHIITESGYWFTKNAMRWFGSRVAWDSLTRIETGYLFITSEQDSGGAWNGRRRYTVRAWDLESGVLPASEFGEFDNMAQAKKYLTNLINNK